MKLLFIVPEYPPHSGGGIASFYKNLLTEFVTLGHEVKVIVGSAFTSKLSSYEKDGIKVEFLDDRLADLNLDKFNRYNAIPEFQRHLAAAWTAWEQVSKGDGYDLIETTDWGMLFAPWIVSADSPPTVVQLHGSIGQIDFYDPKLDSQLQSSLIRLLESNLLAFAEGLQTYSQSNADEWTQLTNKAVSYIPPATPLQIINSTKKSCNGLVVARIQYWKGVVVLCEALRLMGKHAPHIEWIGRDTRYLDSQTSISLYLSQTYPDIWNKKIQPIGTFSTEETRYLQASADFILVPSIWDVFNFTCVEGMSQGKVVICSEGAGASELIINEVNGLTFLPNDPQSLAKSLDNLLSLSPSKRQQLGDAAKETVSKILDPHQIACKRIKSYEKLIKFGKSSTRPNQWLTDAVSPHKTLDKPLAFLDQLPLSSLIEYTIDRSIKKVLRRPQ